MHGGKGNGGIKDVPDRVLNHEWRLMASWQRVERLDLMPMMKLHDMK